MVLVAVLGTVGAPWRDPLRLGVPGRMLPQVLWIWVVLVWWASPVRRAGTPAVVLLPAFLLLPAVVARCWRDEAARRQGLRALAVVVASLSLWSLGDWWLLGAPTAAMPLGHRTLLAAWLVTVLPLAVLPARERGGWRIVGVLAGVLGVGAVLASRSLIGGVALGVEALVAAILLCPQKRRGALLLVFGLVLGVLLGPRLAHIATGTDPSARARAVYWEAGWRGFLARPIVGWGPGATAWTDARFLRPEPGVNPPTEVVGELHSLPLQIAYELGAIGLLLALALAGAFAARRLREMRHAADPGLLTASLLGLAGAGVACLGTAALGVQALPWAVAIAVGGALAALPPSPGGGEGLPEKTEGGQGGEGPGRAFALAAALALAPWVFAESLYDRALAADGAGRRPEAVAELERAIRIDPGFPLYRMRLALLRQDPDLALRAAQDGHGVAALWTVAGILGQAAHRPWARTALISACELGPLDPLPPFFRLQADPGAMSAARSGAHALLAEPRLAAAEVWDGRQALLERSLEEVRRWDGVDPGWKEALLVSVPPSPSPGAERAWIALTLDTDPRESISVLLFRRRPWPTQWQVIPVRRAALERLRLPPATALTTTASSAFAAEVCVTTR
jgi:O-antigen ligase